MQCIVKYYIENYIRLCHYNYLNQCTLSLNLDDCNCKNLYTYFFCLARFHISGETNLNKLPRSILLYFLRRIAVRVIFIKNMKSFFSAKLIIYLMFLLIIQLTHFTDIVAKLHKIKITISHTQFVTFYQKSLFFAIIVSSFYISVDEPMKFVS